MGKPIEVTASFAGLCRDRSGLGDRRGDLEVGYKVAGESLTIQGGIEWCFGPPRVPPMETLRPRQEPRDGLIGGATLYPQSR